MRIAVIGTGISGLGSAWLLHRHHDVVVYEAESRIGGHANTVDVDLGDRTIPVDTGFIVFNHVNYPLLTALFDHLGVATHGSDMSFGVSLDGGAVEYAGGSLSTLFAQKSNLVWPRFQGMLFDILRFNRHAERFLAEGKGQDMSVADYLEEAGLGDAFRDYYFLPMAAAIWSCAIQDVRTFPARSLLGFFANHGLLSVNGHHRWWTVTGGSRAYVQSLAAPFSDRIRTSTPVVRIERRMDKVVVVDGRGGRERYDHVVLACHADQALAAIDRPTDPERATLGAIRYQPNRAVLHRDASHMPRRKSVWSSWNYVSGTAPGSRSDVSVVYWMNRLQNLPTDEQIFVTLNPVAEPRSDRIFAAFDYAHPVLDVDAVRAQRRLEEIQGRDRIWFTGAWCGHGFHEDGLRSAVDVAARFGVRPPWSTPARAPAPFASSGIGHVERAAAGPVRA